MIRYNSTLISWVSVLVTTVVGTTPALAGLVAEAEPNNSIATAQNIDSAFTLDFDPNIQDGLGNNTSTLMPHASVFAFNLDSSPDYYSFNVNAAGTSSIFDIESLFPFIGNTSLYLFDAAGNLLAQNATSAVVDPGSSSTADPFLEYTFASAGLYIIGVGGAASSAGPGGIIGPGPSIFDSYVLNSSVAVPEPVSGLLFCAGITGLAYCHRRKRKRSETPLTDDPADTA